MRTPKLSVAAALAASCVVTSVQAGTTTALTTERIVSGLSSPTFLTHAPGDSERLFVVERAGRIRIIESGTVNATPFLNLTANVSTTFEGGLLGMAFHPDYETNGFFFVYYTESAGGFASVVERYTVTGDPNIADPSSVLRLLRVAQPATNHNSGWIGFSPNDGYLYIPFGDGGFSGSGQQRAQDLTEQPLGKILRIDVNGDDFPADATRNYAIPPTNPYVGIEGDDEIWASGMRNPYRASFDRETGDFWIGDVGAGSREEVDFQPGTSTGGENYGWGCMEGFNCLGSFCTCNAAELTLPVHDYSHTDGTVVTGGVVYRGCAIPDLQGTYFFADYSFSRIWSFDYDGTSMSNFTERTAELVPDVGGINSIVAFGEDLAGEIYIVDLGGEIFKLLAADGSDGCKGGCSADLNGSGDVNAADLAQLLGAWGDCVGCEEDFNGDGEVDAADLAQLLGQWGDCSS